MRNILETIWCGLLVLFTIIAALIAFIVYILLHVVALVATVSGAVLLSLWIASLVMRLIG